MTKLSAFPIPLPPAVEQFRIVDEVEGRLSITDEVEDQIDINLKRAESLGQAVLKNAFLGRID